MKSGSLVVSQLQIRNLEKNGKLLAKWEQMINELRNDFLKGMVTYADSQLAKMGKFLKKNATSFDRKEVERIQEKLNELLQFIWSDEFVCQPVPVRIDQNSQRKTKI